MDNNINKLVEMLHSDNIADAQNECAGTSKKVFAGNQLIAKLVSGATELAKTCKLSLSVTPETHVHLD